MPAIVISSAPAIARAVARPPEGVTRRSAVPWITSVGARDRAQFRGAVARGDDRRELATGAGGVVVAVVAAPGERAQLRRVARQVGRADRLEDAVRCAR